MPQERLPTPDRRTSGGTIQQSLGSIARVVLWTLAFGVAVTLYHKGSEIHQVLRIGAGYKAKILCSAVFVSGRSPESVLAEDLAVDDLWPLRFIPSELDRERGTVQAGFAGMFQAGARYREGHGCTVMPDVSDSANLSGSGGHDARTSRVPPRRPPSGSSPCGGDRSAPWPADCGPGTERPLPTSGPSGHLLPEGEGKNVRPSIAKFCVGGGERAAAPAACAESSSELQAALDWGFAEPDPERLRRTRALLVMQDGKLVAERYAPGFGPDTPLAGWSMAKTALNALVGVLVGQGELHLEAPVHVPEWQGDARSHITLDQLLRMSSGLEFSEEYGDLLQDVTVMLLLQPSAAAFAAAKPLVYPPGSHWYYASGTSNILSRLIRTSVGEDRYRRLSRDALFGPLGMDSAVLELDATGDYVASSFMYATARDWAKLGQLLVQDGVWQGRRMLPAGWVRYSTTPVPADLNGEYGAHLWLKIPESLRGPDPVPLPPDSFHAIGFESQFVTVVPSRRAVLVRLGLTRQPGAWRQDRWVQRVLDALPK